VFEKLLGEGGCPWDRKQTHHSLKPYMLEESAEVVEAIEEDDMAKLMEELGDVLLQVAFHAALAKNRGDFDLNDIVSCVTEKLIRRHPHVFGDEKATNEDEVAELWYRIKKEERQQKSLLINKRQFS